MINLLELNALAGSILEHGNDGSKLEEYKALLERKLSDKREILAKLEKSAEASGSDNAYNRLESAGEAYGYGEELYQLLNDLELGEEWEDIAWQVEDLAKSTLKEWRYRAERAQW
jgi:hypothetical protein